MGGTEHTGTIHGVFGGVAGDVGSLQRMKYTPVPGPGSRWQPRHQ